MTEIGLTAFINLFGLVFAIVLARWVVSVDAGSPDLRRLDGAVKRAVDLQLLRLFRQVSVIGAVALLLPIASQGLRIWGAAPPPHLADTLFCALGTTVGALMACGTAYFSAQLARAGAVRAVAAARRDTAAAVTIILRSTGAAAVFASAVTVLADVLLFLLVVAIDGGFSRGDGMAGATARGALHLTGVAFGAGAAALAIQRAGMVYRTAAAVAAEIAIETSGSLEHHDARNPAVVAALVGSHIGRTAPRVLDFQVAVAMAGALLAPLATLVYEATGSVGAALLPIVVHAFAALASAVGLLVVRVGPRENATRALFRGQLSSTIVATGGLAGATVWLVGAHWRLLFACGLPTLVALVAASYGTRMRARSRFGLPRELSAAQRTGFVPALTTSLGAGLEATVLPVITTGLGLIVTWRLGVMTELPHGGIIALSVATALLLSTAPFVLALATLDPMASDTVGVLALTPEVESDSTIQRVRSLDEAGFAVGHVAQPYLALVGGVVALGAIWILDLAGTPSEKVISSGIDMVRPEVIWGGVVGAAVVLALVGNTARTTARGAIDLAGEIDRQLRRFPREHGVSQIPPGYTPSYRACIDLAAAASARGWVPLAGALAAPLLVAIASAPLGLGDPSPPHRALVALVIVTTATGLGLALAAGSTGTLLTSHRRTPRRPATTDGDSASALAIGETLTTAVGPTALLIVKVVAIAALSLVPSLG
ncbi:MAG: sodium/proton-translocating pyrophosphatase [Polyangiaceae bacterium]|nr:sodium/proton-translocating pyrophosphatase [Polyangiaceae bacterium]